MTKVSGGVITGIIYEKGMPVMIIEGGCVSKVYLNPKVVPNEYKEGLINMNVLFMEGDFLAQCPNLFSPSRVVIKGKHSQLDFQLNLA